MTLITLIYGTPGLPLSKGALAHVEWCGTEQLNTRMRSGVVVAPVRKPIQGTGVPAAALTVTDKDFPFTPVRAGEPGLT